MNFFDCEAAFINAAGISLADFPFFNEVIIDSNSSFVGGSLLMLGWFIF